MNETILRSILQHPVKFYFRMAKWCVAAVLVGTGAYLVGNPAAAAVAAGAVFFAGVLVERRRHASSALKISDQRVFLSVKKGLFSSFEIGLHYSQIINCTFVKSHFLHAFTDSGTLFIRASEKKEGQIVAEFVPKVEEVCRMINALIPMTEERRRQELGTETANEESPESVVEGLKKLPGIRFAALLEKADRAFVFENEEERNHGVYESIRKKHTAFVVHDGNFRRPDSTIVFSSGSKTIFPGVPFHEISRPNALSGSPCEKVHRYLMEKTGLADPDLATVIVGFD